MQFRVGINLGDVIFEEKDLYGDAVNVAARLQAHAQSGGVMISHAVHESVRGRLACVITDCAQLSVKGIALPIRAYRIARPTTSSDQDGARPLSPLLATDQQTGPAIAVLPFDNLSRDPRWTRFCDGLVEDIITDLARHPDLSVIARNSSFMYRSRSLDIRAIGRELGARYVLEGSLQAEAGCLRVTTQLIDAHSGLHVWADRFSRPDNELFLVQDELVTQVVGALAGFNGSIVRFEVGRARRKPASTLRAYELYLLGQEQEARLDHDGTLKSIELLTAALRFDPHFSRAWTVLGWAWGNAADDGWVENRPAAYARRREAILKAAELDPSDSLALTELGGLRLREGDPAGAREMIERALAVGANHADTLALNIKFVATLFGRPEAAINIGLRALTLNPHAPSWYFLGQMFVLYFARQFEASLDAAARGTPVRFQKLFRLLCSAQLDREADVEAARLDLLAADPGLQVLGDTEALLFDSSARDLFADGKRKARL